MAGDRITESELVLPSLYLMTQYNGLIRTSALIVSVIFFTQVLTMMM